MENFPMEKYNTFHVAVNSKYFSEFDSDESLYEILDFMETNKLSHLVLGGGANILFTKDFDGIVIHPVSDNIVVDGDIAVADAGVVWDKLVETTVSMGLGGLENLSLIPGTVGAAPVQNIGAYGVEAKDSILWVEYAGVKDRKLHRISGKECKFGYRDSIFKHELKEEAVILRVAFKLTRESEDYPYNVEYGALRAKVSELGGVSISNIRKATIDIRSSKLPDPAILGSAGSFFRNPEVAKEKLDGIKSRFSEVVYFPLENGNYKISAGWMIEKTGWKGRAIGNAAVHDKQALVLVNKGFATGQDILRLSDSIRHDVENTFGIILHPEVIIL